MVNGNINLLLATYSHLTLLPLVAYDWLWFGIETDPQVIIPIQRDVPWRGLQLYPTPRGEVTFR